MTISKTLYESLKAWQAGDGLQQDFHQRFGLCSYIRRWIILNIPGGKTYEITKEFDALLGSRFEDEVVPFDDSFAKHVSDPRKDLNPRRIQFVKELVEEYENANQP